MREKERERIINKEKYKKESNIYLFFKFVIF